MSEQSRTIPVWVISEPAADDLHGADDGTEETPMLFGRRATVAAATAKVVDIDENTLRTSLADIRAKLDGILASQSAKQDSGFYLESFTVGLALHANGTFALVAEVGVEASIQLVFKCK